MLVTSILLRPPPPLPESPPADRWEEPCRRMGIALLSVRSVYLVSEVLD